LTTALHSLGQHTLVALELMATAAFALSGVKMETDMSALDK